MSTLVFLEHHGDEHPEGRRSASSPRLRRIDPDIAGVLIGSDVAGLAAEAAKYGAASVY